MKPAERTFRHGLKVVRAIATTFALFLILATFGLKLAKSGAAGIERQVEVPLTVKWSPVVIIKVTLGDKVVQVGRMLQGQRSDPVTPFRAGDDWIQNLTFYLYNRTNKTIVYAAVNLVFLEAREVHADIAVPRPRNSILFLGRIPASAADAPHSQPPHQPPISFLPGQTMTIRLSDHINQIRYSLPTVSAFATATKVVIFLDHFYFSDGMLSLDDTYRIADLRDPGKTLRMDPNYFPGDMNLSWPGRPDRSVVTQQDVKQANKEAKNTADTSHSSAPGPMQLIFNVFDSSTRRWSSRLSDILPTGLTPGVEMLFHSAEFSPDGQFLAFDSCGYYQNPRGIYVVRLADRTSQYILPVRGPTCENVRWAADGKRLSLSGSDDHRLHIIDVASGHDTILPNAPMIGWNWWSPKGDQIVFERGSGGTRELFVTDFQGHERQITLMKDFNNQETWAPAWSPDGSRIAFTSERYLYTIAPDGTDLRRLETQGRVYSPRWSTDGEWILFMDGVWLMQIRRNGTDLANIGQFHTPSPFSLGARK